MAAIAALADPAGRAKAEPAHRAAIAEAAKAAVILRPVPNAATRFTSFDIMGAAFGSIPPSAGPGISILAWIILLGPQDRRVPHWFPHPR